MATCSTVPPSSPGERLNAEDLRRLQLAHEGMRLLLSSEVKRAEQLFRKSRYTGPELNAGYSFVQLVRSLMTFEEDAMEAAYKSLESTEKFCDTSRTFSELFSSSSHSQRFSRHQRLYRKSIVADCLLFEAIIVFIRQSLTSYVKGGYLIRKAWKMYEKIYNETELLCSEPSPISRPGVSSPTDRHVGTSVYDDKNDYPAEEGEDEVVEEEEVKKTLAELGDTFAMQLGLGGVASETAGEGEGEREGGEGVQNGSVHSSSPSLAHSQPDSAALKEGTGTTAGDVNGATPHGSLERETSNPADREGGGGGGKEMVDGVKEKRRKKRPLSGYYLPESLPDCDFVTDLGHEDDRLRGAVYFGYGIMNIVLSLIPPKLMKLANLFGFSGDRRLGLQALEFASHSQDMKAPLARIALLWYHTIVRPFFALDGEKEDAGADEADRLLKEAESLYPNSALFLYFKGKVLYLRRQLGDALAVYTSAASLSRDQREIEHIALYEKGWIHFLQLNYAESLPCYIRLKNETRWSACFYAYLCAAMTGVMGDLKESRELFLQSSRLVKRKNNNLEKFCYRRVSGHVANCNRVSSA
jgi:tetratricopeptide (TPR) repeat protein